MKGISTEDAVFRLKDSVFQTIDQQVGGIFGDSVKAFDCVDHEILLDKLHFYGIRRVSEDWFRSYLANRRQKVQVKSSNTSKNNFSDWGTMTNRVPRGSVL
jgi:hypothetical protein